MKFDKFSRVIIIDGPTKAPGECFSCRSFKGPMIDFNRSFMKYGALYLCFECVEGIAGLFGFEVKPDIDLQLIMSKYLQQHDLRVVSNEYVATVDRFIASMFDGVNNDVPDFSVEDSREESPAEPAILESDDTAVERVFDPSFD